MKQEEIYVDDVTIRLTTTTATDYPPHECPPWLEQPDSILIQAEYPAGGLTFYEWRVANAATENEARAGIIRKIQQHLRASQIARRTISPPRYAVTP